MKNSKVQLKGSLQDNDINVTTTTTTTFSQGDRKNDLNNSTLLDTREEQAPIFPYIFIIGELAILGMEESEESSLSKLHITCI